MIYILNTKQGLFRYHSYTMYDKLTLLNTKMSTYVQTNVYMFLFIFVYYYYYLCIFFINVFFCCILGHSVSCYANALLENIVFLKTI